jgi:hypothetical protein
VNTQLFVNIGGENVRFDIQREIDVGSTKYDAIVSVPASTAATPTTLWTSASNGVAVSAATFTLLAVIVDPDETLSTTLPINLRLTYTTTGGSATAYTRYHRVSGGAAFMLTNSLSGAPGSAYTDYITKVEAYNEDTTNAIPVRTLVLF